MTHPAILQRTAEMAKLADDLRATENIRYETNARASAVADLFWRRLRGIERLDDVGIDLLDIPLAELVTPEEFPSWRSEFNDPKRMAYWRKTFDATGILLPRVRPRPDGKLGVMVTYTHPEATEPAWAATQVAWLIELRMSLVVDPDDWRLDDIV